MTRTWQDGFTKPGWLLDNERSGCLIACYRWASSCPQFVCLTYCLMLLCLRVCCFVFIFAVFFVCVCFAAGCWFRPDCISGLKLPPLLACGLSQGVPFLGHLHAKQLHLDLQQLLQHRFTECVWIVHTARRKNFRVEKESPTGTIIFPEGASFSSSNMTHWCRLYRDYLHLSSNAYVNIFVVRIVEKFIHAFLSHLLCGVRLDLNINQCA